ncbi:MAG: glycosyltransferase family 2 protein [Candidatus Gastranaerophilales bacterium]|nr:glycosyltransferase family 2 protein [Candidatus Gastranaerophilales bacterium]
MEISVVIPCLNEEETLKICIEKCFKAFKNLGIKGEVIIADNGSNDNSIVIAQNEGANVINVIEKGYGNALRGGFKAATGKYLVMGDADNTYDFLEIPLLYNELDEDTDMVIGSRLKGNIEKRAMPPLHRYVGTPVITALINLLYGTKISDSQCGMRLIKKEAIEQLNLQSTGMEFASELIIKFAKAKMKIKEIPISLHKDIEGRTPHLNPIRDGLRHLRLILKSLFI